VSVVVDGLIIQTYLDRAGRAFRRTSILESHRLAEARASRDGVYMTGHSARRYNRIDSLPYKTSWTGHAEESMRRASQAGSDQELSEMHSE
jgi:hypothetical protein